MSDPSGRPPARPEEERRPGAPHGGEGALHWLLLALVIAWLLWFRQSGELEVHPDTVRDLLDSRAFLGSWPPTLRGPVASFSEFYQGAPWYLYLAVAQALGLALDGIRTLSLVLILMAVAGIGQLGKVLAGSLTGTLAASLLTLSLLGSRELLVVQWNPLLVTPLSVALLLLTVRAAQGPSLGRWLAVAALFSLLVQFHLAAGAAALPLVALFTRHRPGRPLLTLALAAAVVVLLWFVLSWEAALANWARLWLGPTPGGEHRGNPWPPALVAAFSLLALVLPRLRRPLREPLAPGLRALLWLTAGTGLTTALALLLAGRELEPRYLAPVLPGSAVLLALVMAHTWRRLFATPPAAARRWRWLERAGAQGRKLAPVAPALALLVIGWPLSAPERGSHRDLSARNRLTFADVESVAGELARQGVTEMAGVRCRLASPAMATLLAALPLHLDADDGRACLASESAEPLLVARLPDHALAGLSSLPKVLKRDDRGTLAMVPVAATLDWNDFAWEGRSRLAGSTWEMPEAVRMYLSPDSNSGQPALAGLTRRADLAAIRITAALDLQPDSPLTVAPLPPAGASNAVARVEAVAGAGVGSLLPAPSAVVEPGMEGGRALITMVWEFDHIDPGPSAVAPPVLVYPAGEPGWTEFLAGLLHEAKPGE